MPTDRPLVNYPAARLLAIVGGRDLRKKPMDPRIEREVVTEIERRKATGEWRKAA